MYFRINVASVFMLQVVKSKITGQNIVAEGGNMATVKSFTISVYIRKVSGQ